MRLGILKSRCFCLIYELFSLFSSCSDLTGEDCFFFVDGRDVILLLVVKCEQFVIELFEDIGS